MDDTKKWIFPKYIAFEDIADLMTKFSKCKIKDEIVFDLSDTIRVHSSFIGFLIHAKSVIEKNNGSLKLIISSPLQKLFSMLQVYNHFSDTLLASSIKRSA